MLRGLAAILTLAAAPASAWTADNLLTVNDLPGGGFEVVGGPGLAPSDYWCAAGDYALRVLRAPTTARVYLTRARGAAVTANRKSAVHFDLRPAQDAPPRDGVFLTVRRAGAHLSVGFAISYCENRKSLDF